MYANNKINKEIRNMKFTRIYLEEYLNRLPENFKKNKKGKTYLEECLENNTAEYYIIDNNKEFFFYKKENDIVGLCVDEKGMESIFDNKKIMNAIFEFLKQKGYKKAIISLDKNHYIKRHNLALEYGFEEKEIFKQNDFEYVNFEKNL